MKIKESNIKKEESSISLKTPFNSYDLDNENN